MRRFAPARWPWRRQLNARSLSGIGMAMRAILLGLSLGLSACPVYQVNRLPESAALGQPIPLSVAGDFRHEPSQFVFPVAVGGFTRVAMMRYDSAGLHVSAGYNGGTPACPVIVTHYVYPAPRMQFLGADPAVVRSLESQWADAEYLRSKQEILHSHPGAALQNEDSRIEEAGPAKKAVFRINSNRSELFVFLRNRTWFLKYRHTYPEACAPDAQRSLDDFYKRLFGGAA